MASEHQPVDIIGPLKATRMLLDGSAVLVRAAQWARQWRPVDSYACQECGRSDGLDAVVTDDVWATISRGQNLLCLWCIDRRCKDAGVAATVSLHFQGQAITGTSQSDADAAQIDHLTAENDRLKRENAALREAQRLAAIRLGILTGRMRACHAETGRHELLDEAEMFEQEARAALAAAGGD